MRLFPIALSLALSILPIACLGDAPKKSELSEIVLKGTLEDVSVFFSSENLSAVPKYVYQAEFTLLHIAIGNRRNPEVVAFLANLDANIFAEDYRKRTPLLLAIDNGNVPAVEILTEISGYADHVGGFGMSAIGYCKDVLAHYPSNQVCHVLLKKFEN